MMTHGLCVLQPRALTMKEGMHLIIDMNIYKMYMTM